MIGTQASDADTAVAQDAADIADLIGRFIQRPAMGYAHPRDGVEG
jgi:hypothetical protein